MPLPPRTLDVPQGSYGGLLGRITGHPRIKAEYKHSEGACQTAGMAALSIGLDVKDGVWALVAVTGICISAGFAVNALYTIVFSMKGNDAKVLTLSTLGEWRRGCLVCIGRFSPPFVRFLCAEN
ncbi:MAG: hypothetical protein ACI9W2_000994 [Gammaproteobacteria bacterium]|jgi:hypothetical protein